MSPQFYKDLKQAEGLRLKAYQCSANVWTIGYGRNLQELTITEAQAETWLNEDVVAAATEAEKLPEWKHLDTTARQEAVIELVFNMGLPRLMGFVKARAAIARKDWVTAAMELLDSTWAKQVGPNRSNRVARLIETGEYPQP